MWMSGRSCCACWEWVLMLPETLGRQVEEFIEEYKRELETPFVSRLERRAIEKGLAEGPRG